MATLGYPPQKTTTTTATADHNPHNCTPVFRCCNASPRQFHFCVALSSELWLRVTNSSPPNNNNNNNNNNTLFLPRRRCALRSTTKSRTATSARTLTSCTGAAANAPARCFPKPHLEASATSASSASRSPARWRQRRLSSMRHRRQLPPRTASASSLARVMPASIKWLGRPPPRIGTASPVRPASQTTTPIHSPPARSACRAGTPQQDPRSPAPSISAHPAPLTTMQTLAPLALPVGRVTLSLRAPLAPATITPARRAPSTTTGTHQLPAIAAARVTSSLAHHLASASSSSAPRAQPTQTVCPAAHARHATPHLASKRFLARRLVGRHAYAVLVRRR